MIYGTTVLIIDDEKDICDLISDILQDEGFRCSTAKNSDEAIEKITKLAPNLILLDIWLQNSNLDGLGILQPNLATFILQILSFLARPHYHRL
jgi:DNA-binding NtrC family response regulator